MSIVFFIQILLMGSLETAHHNYQEPPCLSILWYKKIWNSTTTCYRALLHYAFVAITFKNNVCVPLPPPPDCAWKHKANTRRRDMKDMGISLVLWRLLSICIMGSVVRNILITLIAHYLELNVSLIWTLSTSEGVKSTTSAPKPPKI